MRKPLLRTRTAWADRQNLDCRITIYLDRCPPAISGESGHSQTFSVACALVHGFRLNAEDCYRYLLHYNQRCCPPWSERELRHKVASALSSSSDKPNGYLL